MRSRYTAYALGEFQYVLDTYGKAQRENLSVSLLSEGSESQKWVRLVIHNTDESVLPKEVEFSAFYLQGNNLFELRELSFFETEDGNLKYTDGNILVNEKVKQLTRNDSCPCGSEKKFKKCCGK